MQINGLGAGIKLKAAGAADSTQVTEAFAAKMEKAAASIQDDKEKAKLKEVCKDMEAVYLNLMLSKMRATVPKSKLMGDSSQEEMFRSLLDSEMTKNLAKAGGIGLADMLYRQLTIEAETQNKSQAPK